MVEFLKQYLLTILIFLPLAGAVVTMLARGRNEARWTALATTLATFALSLPIIFWLGGEQRQPAVPAPAASPTTS